MQEQLDKYWNYLRIERQVSPHTLTNYQRQLYRIVDILAENGITSWQAVTPSVVRFILAQSNKDGLKERSLALRLSVLRRFFTYLVQQQDINVNPATGVSAPNKIDTYRRILTLNKYSNY